MERKIAILIVCIFQVACQDVIQIDAPAEAPRLVVSALIRIDGNEPTTTATVKVGLTSSFFGEMEAADLKQITIINSDYTPSGPLDVNYITLLKTAPGQYEASKSTSFFTDGELQLNIEYEDQRYIATTRYAATVPIDSLAQGDGTLFEGNETEVMISFTDAPNREDFYLFDFDFNEYLVAEDIFYPGQPFRFSFFYDDRVKPGQELVISILGIDKSFFNYMNQLIIQGNSGDQGPFQTPSATVRGNIINVTELDNIDNFDNVGQHDNFALGYFAVSQEYTKTIVIE